MYVAKVSLGSGWIRTFDFRGHLWMYPPFQVPPFPPYLLPVLLLVGECHYLFPLSILSLLVSLMYLWHGHHHCCYGLIWHQSVFAKSTKVWWLVIDARYTNNIPTVSKISRLLRNEIRRTKSDKMDICETSRQQELAQENSHFFSRVFIDRLK